MKPALVLGLALAANAFSPEQLDNELIIAPTDQFGNIREYPRNIRFDEQPDDELLIRPISTQIADDELRVAPRDEFGNIKYPNPWIRYDEDGNEFFAAPTHKLGEMGHRILYDNELARAAGDVKELLERQMEYKGRFDDEADDELLAKPQKNQPKPSIIPSKCFSENRAEELRKRAERNRLEASQKDDEADNELRIAPNDEFGKTKPSYIRYDEKGNELWFFSIPRYNNLTGRIPGIIADDELMIDNEQFAAHAKTRHKKSHPGLDHFNKKHPEIALDDELLMKPTSAQFDDNELIKAPKNRYLGNIVYDDEADDEFLTRPQYHDTRPIFSEIRIENLLREAERNKIKAGRNNGGRSKKPQNGGMISEMRAQGTREKAEKTKRNKDPKKEIGSQPQPSQSKDLHSHQVDKKKTERNKTYQALHSGARPDLPPQTTPGPLPNGVFVEMRALGLRSDKPVVSSVAADDELRSGGPHMSARLFVDRQGRPEASQKDDEAGDEFYARPGPYEAQQNHPKPTMASKLFVDKQRRPEASQKDDEVDDELFATQTAQENQQNSRGENKRYFSEVRAQGMRDKPKGNKRNQALKSKAGPQTKPSKPEDRKKARHADRKNERNMDYQSLHRIIASQPSRTGVPVAHMFSEVRALGIRGKADQNKRNEALEKNAGPQPSQPEDSQPISPGVFAEIRAEGLRYQGPAASHFFSQKDNKVKNEARNEILAMPDPHGAQNSGPAPNGVGTKLFVDRQRKPQTLTNDDEGDDEFSTRPVSSEAQNKHNKHMASLRPTLFVNSKPQAMKNDDELVYLGELIQEGQKRGPHPKGAFVRVLDDSELFAGKPAPLKHKEAQISGAFVRVLDDNDDELFEVKGKVRPFLPFS